MAQTVLLGLQILYAIISFLREQGLIAAGVDKQIAQTSAAILVKSQWAKEIMQEVTAMTEEQVDQTLKELEPK